MSAYAEDGHWVTLRDGCHVYAKVWETPTAPPMATLAFVHGVGEHIHRYEHVFERLAQAGIEVHSYDQRGFGRTYKHSATTSPNSPPAATHKLQNAKGHNHGWDCVLEDVRECVERAKKDNIPVFVYGHSMGGLVSLDFGRVWGTKCGLAGVISTSPAIGTHPKSTPGALKYYAGLVLSQVAPTALISTELDAGNLSHCAKVIETYKADEHNHGDVSLLTGRDLLQLGKRYRKDDYAMGAQWPASLPLLMLHGDQDELCWVDCSKGFYKRVPAKDKTLKIYKGYFHELHNEPDIKDEVIQDIIDWISQHVKTPLVSGDHSQQQPGSLATAQAASTEH
ncbi:hypothetical protein RI367_003895 [Sorochytrium milnesiophthora]